MGSRLHYPAPDCPRCTDSDNKVKNTYYTDDGRIVRTRTCSTCGWKWWTVQYPELNLDPAMFKLTIPNFNSPGGASKRIKISHV